MYSKRKESSIESVSSSDDDGDDDDKQRLPRKGEEVVKKWQTRSRNKGLDLGENLATFN